MGRVSHFEISSDNPERAIKFYQGVFGWDVNQWGDQEYWMLSTGTEAEGINGAIMPRPDYAGNTSVVNTIMVDDLVATVAKIEAHGGSVVVPKMAIPEMGYLVYFRDSEGNVLGVMQADSSAA